MYTIEACARTVAIGFLDTANLQVWKVDKRKFLSEENCKFLKEDI